jgi:hypothetical protein
VRAESVGRCGGYPDALATADAGRRAPAGKFETSFMRSSSSSSESRSPTVRPQPETAEQAGPALTLGQLVRRQPQEDVVYCFFRRIEEQHDGSHTEQTG